MTFDVLLRPATQQDAAQILHLEEAGMRTYAEALWGNWTPSSIPETLSVVGHEMIVSLGQSVGCIACEWQPDHMRIRKLYLAPQSRGRGLGATALRLKLQTALAQGLATRLTVLITNPDAQRFYKREGFSDIETTAERITLEYDPSRPQE